MRGALRGVSWAAMRRSRWVALAGLVAGLLGLSAVADQIVMPSDSTQVAMFSFTDGANVADEFFDATSWVTGNLVSSDPSARRGIVRSVVAFDISEPAVQDAIGGLAQTGSNYRAFIDLSGITYDLTRDFRFDVAFRQNQLHNGQADLSDYGIGTFSGSPSLSTAERRASASFDVTAGLMNDHGQDFSEFVLTGGSLFGGADLIRVAQVALRIETAPAPLSGDFDSSGFVEQGDLNFVLNNWGGPRTFDDHTSTFVTNAVDQEELNAVLNNWGASAAASFDGFAVPEPMAVGLSCVGALATRLRRPH